MDRPVRRLFLFFALLFVALIAQLTYVQIVDAPKLNIEPSNTRAIAEEMKVERGDIVSADGVVLAENEEADGYFTRVYPRGSLCAPWLGYSSAQYGRAGIELVNNQDLIGQSGILGVTSYWDRIAGKTHHGADLELTINVAVQQAAAEALVDRRGAVVALDPRTGAVLAMVSSPRYDPNELASIWDQLSDEEGPLFNRATLGLYPPGSVFKVIVAAAALETGAVTPTTMFDDTGTYTAGGYEVSNYDDRHYDQHDFTKAFASSVNTTFAKLGVEMGADTLSRYAADFGFGEEPPWALGGAASVFPDPGSMDEAHVAQAAFGQGEVLVTPLEMALATCAVANRGAIMKPYLVNRVKDPEGNVIRQTEPEVWREPITSATAATLTDLMVEVVNTGTGTEAQLSGVQVAGKTGTAEITDAEPHAWFAGFAPAENPRVVVVVLVENAGTGGTVAAPIARAVIAKALGQ
jgi:peptidoglycan glycosyltransferase